MTKNAARLNAKEEDERREALAVIAGDLGLDASALRIESLIESRPAVFYDMPDGTTRSACSLDLSGLFSVPKKILAAKTLDSWTKFS